MPRDPELFEQRNERIKEEFEKLTATREFGARKFHNDYCLARVAQQYFLSPRTVERIIFSRD